VATVQRFVNTGSAGGDGTTNGTGGADAAYASLSSWEANQAGAGTDDYIVDCCAEDTGSGNVADTTPLTLNFVTTPLSITIRGNRSHAAGFYDGDQLISTAHYRLTSAAGSNLVLEENVTIDGIQFEHTSANAFRTCISVGTGNVTIRKCHFRGTGTCRSGIGPDTAIGGTTSTRTYENNVFSGFATGGIEQNIANFSNATMHIRSNTIYASGTVSCITVTGGTSGAPTTNISNNICANSSDPFDVTVTGSINYNVNGTDDGAQGTTGEVDLTPGAGDLDDVFTARGSLQTSELTLIAGSPAIDTGTSTSQPVDDIRDLPRSGSFDLGAYEVQGGGGGDPGGGFKTWWSGHNKLIGGALAA
jgi:hypothetical protein